MAEASSKAEDLRVKGNDAFKSGKMHDAVVLYTKALEELAEEDDNRALVLANRSLAYMRLKNPRAALDDADAALIVRPAWGKAIHRRAKALESLGRDIDGYRMLVDVLEVKESMTPDIDADQRKYLGELLAAFRKRLLTRLRPSRFLKDAGGTTDEWLASIEAQESWRMRLATLAHCWNASDEAGRMAVLKAAQADLASPPAPGSVPIEHFATHAAQPASTPPAAAAAAAADSSSGASPSTQELESLVREMLSGAAESPPDPETAGVKEGDLKPFPLHNYADITPPGPVIAFFAALPTAEKSALWRHTWQRLRFFEKVLAANDFAMFFAPLIRLCPALDRAVVRLREATEAAAAAAAAKHATGDVDASGPAADEDAAAAASGAGGDAF